MIKLNLQFFGGRGAGSSSGGGEGRYKGGASLKDSDILSTTSLISERERQQALVDETLDVFNDLYEEYGLPVNDIEIATLKAGVTAMAYYDSDGSVAFNKAYFNPDAIGKAYAKDVASGFHPSNGNKTALQAVAAHEIGHHLTAQIGAKQGWGNLEQSATKIVEEARKSTKHRGVVKMASKISRYATSSNGEAIAEAVSDVFCNGGKAKAESKAIVSVLKKYNN